MMKKSEPLVSIVMPVFNAERFLCEALQSIISQTFERFEAIIIDDGSDDATPALLSNEAQHDSRLKIIQHTSNKGIIAALNTGIAHARGMFIARMDTDDRMHPDRLSSQYNYFRKYPKTDVVGCLVEKFSDSEIKDGYRSYMRWLNSLVTHEDICREIFVEAPFAHPSVMMRTDIVRNAGCYRDHRWPEDYDLWLRLFSAGCTFGKVNKILHYWRDNADRLSRTDDRYSLINFHKCKAHYFAKTILKNGGEVIIWGAKRTARNFSSTLLAHQIQPVAYVDVSPTLIGTCKDGIPVIAPDDVLRFRDIPIVCYVSVSGAKQKIRSFLTLHNYVEGKDFFMMV